MYVGYWWESQNERDRYEDQDDNTKMDLREKG
jgi:hypothetical protein